MGYNVVSVWIPGEGNDNPLQYSCLENSHGQRRLAGHSPLSHKSWTWLSNQTTTTSMDLPVLAIVPLWQLMLIMWESVCVVGQNIWQLSVLSSQFFCELKTALKNKVYLKKYSHIYLFLYCQSVKSTETDNTHRHSFT